MTKNELEQYRDICREIHNIEWQIRYLEAKAKSTTSTLTGMPYGRGISDKTSIAVDIADYKQELEERKKRCVDMRQGILDYISSIEDSCMRQIMEFRYIWGMSWQEVAFKIGEHDESYPRKKYNKFMKVAEFAE